MKKIIKRIIVVFISFILLIGIVGFIGIRSVIYPKVLVSGHGKYTVLCVGDSITYGQGVLFKRKKESYPALLQNELGDEYKVKNYGLCNRTLLKDSMMSYVNEDYYNESLKENADYVTIMLGTNDSKSGIWNKENFKVEAKDFIESYINMESNPKVYVMLPPRIYIDGSNGNCNNETLVNEVIPLLKEVSSSLNVEVIDLYNVTDNHEDYFSDGLHPNFEGNKIIAKEIEKAIKK